MQPDQNQEHPNPNLPQQDTNPPAQPPSQVSGGSRKIIQPLSPNITADPEPSPTTSPTTPVTDATHTPNFDSSSIYPEPKVFVSHVANPLSKADIENENKQRKKRTRLVLALASLLVVILVGGGIFYYWYSQQDHSVYAKLTSETYNKSGVSFNFEYPSVMQYNPSMVANLKGAVAGYSYYIGTKVQAVVFVSVIPIGVILQNLNLKPTQFLAQVRADSGSFVTATKSTSAFAGCNSTLITTSGQTAVLCKNNPSDYVNVRVVGATNTYQYTLFLDMLPSVLTTHQKVWQKVEKSFSFQ